MQRIIIIGAAGRITAEILNDIAAHEHTDRTQTRVPYYEKPSHLDLHPNDNWRGKGKQKNDLNRG